MKVLSLAMVGAFGYVGVASAACPADPVAPVGAWSAKSALGGTLKIEAGGLDGTECRLDASFPVNIPGATAYVRDNSPSAEQRYRAQFLIDAGSMTTMTGLQSVKIFGAASDTAANGISELVKLSVFGDAIDPNAKLLGITGACGSSGTFLCATNTPLAAGVNRVEIDWNKATGELKVWVNSTTEASVTKTVALGNVSAWNGVDYAILGLSTASPAFMSGQAGKIVKFDRFDSRRQTFIGN